MNLFPLLRIYMIIVTFTRNVNGESHDYPNIANEIKKTNNNYLQYFVRLLTGKSENVDKVFVIFNDNIDIRSTPIRELEKEIINRIDDSNYESNEYDEAVFNEEGKKDDFEDSQIFKKKHTNFKPSLRAGAGLENEFREKKKAQLVRAQHDAKVKEINEFMEDHWMSTNYFYDEMQRIKKQRKVKDELREMVVYLDDPDRSQIRSDVLDCYYRIRDNAKKPVDVWKHHTNNLVINYLKDPYNDNVN